MKIIIYIPSTVLQKKDNKRQTYVSQKSIIQKGNKCMVINRHT